MPEAYSDYLTALVRLTGRGYDIERVAGISLGGCVDAIGTERVGAMRRSGHAHTSKDSQHRGWICIKSSKPERIVTPTGRPTTLLIHEVGHIVTWDGHTARFCKAVAALGAPGEAKKVAKYVAKRRTPLTWYWTDPATGERHTGTHAQMRLETGR